MKLVQKVYSLVVNELWLQSNVDLFVCRYEQNLEEQFEDFHLI